MKVRLYALDRFQEPFFILEGSVEELILPLLSLLREGKTLILEPVKGEKHG